MVPKMNSKKKARNVSVQEPETDEEDYEVADLSAIPAPKVEFVMPNLTPLDSCKAERKSKPKSKSKKENESSGVERALTAEALNNEIVRMRPVINKARTSLVRHLVRKLKRFKSVIEKRPSEALQKKVRRYQEEIHAMKSIPRDDVSKFALLNKKSLNELRITGTTPVNERCLFKLSCERCVVKAVEEYRARYPSWEVTTAFLLQRLGLQYSVEKGIKDLLSRNSGAPDDSVESQGACTCKNPITMKTTKTLLDARSAKKPRLSESIRDFSNQEDSLGDPDSSGEEHDVEIGSDSNDDEDQAVENRRKLLLGSIKEPMKANQKKRKRLKGKHKGDVTMPSTSGRENVVTAVVKQVKLGRGGKIELEKPVEKETVGKVSDEPRSYEDATPHRGFFLPASLANEIETLRHKKSGDDALPARSESSASKSSESAAKLMKLKKKKKDRGTTKTGSNSLLKPQKNSNAKESQTLTEPSRHKRRGDVAAPARSETTLLKSQESAAKPKKLNKEKDRSSAKTERKSLLNSQAHTNAKQSQIPIEELHPSWAARRRAKEQQSSAPKGKRIVFSDD